MKYYNRLLLMAATVMMVSCADIEFADYTVEKPEKLAEYEYLNAYDALKAYIDRSAYPNFKLGGGVNADEFLKRELVYALATSNYDEITAGNAMKYSASVKDDGSMDFSQVVSFIDMARSAGLTIYGHTLAWHSQQNNTYLNGLIADKAVEVNPDDEIDVQDALVDYSQLNSFPYWHGGPVTPEVKDGVLVVTNPEKQPNFWDVQFHIANSIPTVAGGNYKVTLYIKGSSAGTITLCLGDWGGNKNTKIEFTQDWQEVSADLKEISSTNSFVMLQSGDYAGTYEIKWVKVTHSEAAGPATWWTNIVTNGDAEGSDVSCFFATEQGVGGPKAATIGAVGTGADGAGHAFVVRSADDPPQTHSTQFFVKVPRQLVAGDKYRFTMKYKAEKAATSETQAHNNPGGYLHWQMLSYAPSFTTSWQENTWEGTITDSQNGMNTIAFNLAVFKEANTYYFDDIKFEIEESGSTIPQTPEEKADTLTWAMGNWVRGMMEACDGYVTAWDVVNEPISGGGNDGEGFYVLQSASNVSEEDAKNNFYWQDYLGSEGYVRTVVGLARKYFAEYGGVSSNLKLFINDYNLESWWDDNKKVKSLIHWIEKWEADGVTKIDGIGTQMHVSYILNDADQKRQEEAIVKMFELLAASGKLIKITELDMGIVEKAFGAGIKTENVTSEQQQKMAEFYTFIIKKYLEIIPVAQQYGITQWAATDSQSGSGWRAGEPIGLWDLNYSRKHTYAGFANGLAGK